MAGGGTTRATAKSGGDTTEGDKEVHVCVCVCARARARVYTRERDLLGMRRGHVQLFILQSLYKFLFIPR